MIPAMQCLAKNWISAAQNLQNLFKFHSYLLDNLLTLSHIRLGVVARKALACTADREALVIEQAADLANDQDVLSLVIAAIAATLDRLELRELLLPVPEDMRLDSAEVAHFTYREVTLPRYRR